MKADAGESPAAINRRSDQDAWDRAQPLLAAGAHLIRVAGINRYYATDEAGQPSTGGLSPSFVRKLELDGRLRHVGVDRYALT